MYRFSDFTITKREILFSFIILFISLCLGIVINNVLDEHFIKKEELINKALKINNDNEKFKYSIDTNVGNIINYGKFEAIDVVKDDWLTDSYLAYEKVTEKYRKHTRTSCSGSGKTRTCHTETYHTWDRVDSYKVYANKVNYSGIQFSVSSFCNYPWNRLNISSATINSNVGYLKNNYIYQKDRLWASTGDIRYYYEVIPKSFYGTTLGQALNGRYQSLDNDKIEINYQGLEDYINSQKSNKLVSKIIFWIIYIVLVCIGIYYFIYIENEWLED